jgi:hypothetical protein
MALIATDKVLEAGFTSSPTACATGGDEFVNSGVEWVKIENTHASQAYNVTFVAQTTSIKHQNYGALTKSNIVKQVNAGNTAYIGPFKQQAFNDANSKVQITYLTTGGAALSTVSSGDHALTIEVLYLEQI